MEHPGIDERCRAALLEAKRWASQIVDGTVSPYDGAHQIASKLADCYDFHGHDLELVELLGAFSGYADEYQEVVLDPSRRREVDSDVVQSANEFLAVAAATEL